MSQYKKAIKVLEEIALFEKKETKAKKKLFSKFISFDKKLRAHSKKLKL